MPIFPKLPEGALHRIPTERFLGYDRSAAAPEGAFHDTLNLSTGRCPALCTRPRRGVVRTLTAPGGLIAKDALCTVENGTLFVNGLPTALTGLSAGDKQLVSMGATLVIFPDKVYYNTADPSDFGSLEAVWSGVGAVRFQPCNDLGEVYTVASRADAEPASPENGAIWADTGGDGTVLRQWSEAQGLWVELPAVFTRITFETAGQLPALFAAYDGVEISGLGDAELDGSKVIYALGGRAGGEGAEPEADWIAVVGLCDCERLEENRTVRISRSLPPLDFVCEAGNRLWGCYYGNDGEKNINEICCSSLGDFKNWRQYLGLSTDSWSASVGSDGPWTGAVSYLGSPCFFKEDRVHRVTISSAGAHRLDETPLRGVQRGSHKSLCVVGETLFYKAPGGVFAWQGGFPHCVSRALGDRVYSDAAAGAVDGCYYISMRGERGWELFCYDSERGLWMREDALHVTAFTASGGELWAIDGDGRLLALRGTQGTVEQSLPWMAETGALRYRTPLRQRLLRLSLSLRQEPGRTVRVWLRYDSRGDWELAGRFTLCSRGTATIPIRPRRCDHFALRVEGEGDCEIEALSRVVEGGSER